jgi:hypothetical protein
VGRLYAWCECLSVTLRQRAAAPWQGGGSGGHVVAMASVVGVHLRADTDNAIELTVADDG